MPSARDIAFIGSRLLALYVLVGSLRTIALNTWLLGGAFLSQEQWSVSDKVVEWGLYTVPMAGLLVLVVILWARADWIADKVTAEITEERSPDSGGWSRQSVLSVAVVAIGLWLLVDRLPLFLQYLYLYFARDAGTEIPASTSVSFASTLLAIVLGLLCVFGAQTLSGFVARARRW